ncbi:hypothetical protein HYH03_018717 [Edaphochlamys debaryana]|uniref:Guanylate cyclase domain-containing protein n=1 Tax=Edaphochlamys debaryana TaxID=47281 RepID=A0A835XG07_9CHLO|nr:hypothetical protein HYH03_018717 [Edaphochlamys debaryana]|eukprot:KAG2482347.1 hypothetical protein HYH03_018717 [Edaphochlamys debaryana]
MGRGPSEWPSHRNGPNSLGPLLRVAAGSTAALLQELDQIEAAVTELEAGMCGDEVQISIMGELQVMWPTILHIIDAFMAPNQDQGGSTGLGPGSAPALSAGVVLNNYTNITSARGTLPFPMTLYTELQVSLPDTQFDVNWLSFDPLTFDGFHGRATPQDYMISYYSALWDWSRGNQSSVEEVDQRAPAVMPASLDPLPDRLQPRTWIALFYRRDWLPAAVEAARAAAGLPASSGGGGAAAAQAPATWEELLALAAAVEGRDLDGDGQPEHGLCLDTMRACKVWGLLSAVYASMAQTEGQQQGVWFDRATMRPLVHNPAMRAALDMWRQLAGTSWPPQPNTTRTSHALGHNITTADCPPINPHFAGGRCLFTLDWAHSLPFLTAERAPGVAGRLGMALAPGSTRVWEQPAPQHWTSLQPPQPGVPFAQPQSLPLYIQAPLEGYPPKNRTFADVVTSIAAAEGASGGATVGPQDGSAGPDGLQWCVNGTTCAAPFAERLAGGSLAAAVLGPGGPAEGVWVNRAPLASVARLMLLEADPKDMTSRQSDAIYVLLGEIYYKGVPMYGEIFEKWTAARANGSAAAAVDWLQLGFHVDDGPALHAGLAAGDNHPNSAIEIRTLHTAGYRIALDEAAFAAAAYEGELTPRAAAPLLSDLFNKFVFVLGGVPFQRTIQGIYWRTLHYMPLGPHPIDPKIPAPAPDNSWGLPRSAVVAAIAVPMAVLLLIIAVVGAVVYRYRSRRSLLSGRVLPPKWGPDVTLVATDIQNSTLLWELLPTEVMNACLSVHHGEVRKALEAHGGHEVSTEGDAFLASFHTPWAALSFSLDLQARLLDADWPPLLLATCDGAEAWAAPNPQVLEAMAGAGPFPRISTRASASQGPSPNWHPSSLHASFAKPTSGSPRLRGPIASLDGILPTATQ